MSGRARDAVALAPLILVAAVLCTRGLHDATSYDEGVYLASLDALRHGQHLGSDVFASQPPGFYVLLRVLGAVAGRSIEGIRIGMVVLALFGVGAAYFLGRRLAGIGGGAAAAAVVVAAPPYAAQAPRVAADTPSIALALCALVLAAYGFRRGGVALAAGAGAFAAAAVSVKLLALPVVVPLAVLAWHRRIGARTTAAFVGGAALVLVALVALYAGVLGDLWRDAVGFHREARSVGIGESAGSRLLDYFSPRTPTTWVAAGGLVAAVAFRRHAALWAWVVAAAVFLLLQAPLLDHHFVLLAAALGSAAGAALVSGRGRLALAGLAVACVGAAAGWVQDYRQIDRSKSPEPTEVRQAADAVRAFTRPGELVASDLPIVPYLADRRIPGDLVDTSFVRFASGSLTTQEVMRMATRVFVAGREFSLHGLPRGNFRVARRFGSIRILIRR